MMGPAAAHLLAHYVLSGQSYGDPVAAGKSDGSTWSTIVASATYSFASGSNSVPVSFTSYSTRYVRANITANSGWTAPQLSELQVYGPTSAGTNLAAGRPTSEGGHTQTYASGNAVDSNQATYWEGPANNWAANWLQVDLGSAVANLNKVTVKLPTTWGARTETFSVQGSTDGTNFSTLVASATYSFAPTRQHRRRHLRLDDPALRPARVHGQLAGDRRPGLRARGLRRDRWRHAGADRHRPTSPAPRPAPTSTLTWTASTDNVGVTGYDIYANGTLLTSVGNVTDLHATGVATSATVVVHGQGARRGRQPVGREQQL